MRNELVTLSGVAVNPNSLLVRSDFHYSRAIRKCVIRMEKMAWCENMLRFDLYNLYKL